MYFWSDSRGYLAGIFPAFMACYRARAGFAGEGDVLLEVE